MLILIVREAAGKEQAGADQAPRGHAWPAGQQDHADGEADQGPVLEPFQLDEGELCPGTEHGK